MQNLEVTLVQTHQIWENKQANLKHFESLLSTIESTDLILLPEMFHTGFSMNSKELAEDSNNSEGIEWLKKMAFKKSAAIYTSLIVKENDNYFNRGVFVYPDGNTVNYDKQKLFTLANEDDHYTAGNKRIIVAYKDWKFQLNICYDLRFPEISRNSIDNTNLLPVYDVLLYVANWPERRRLHWKTLLQARAIENQCYSIGVNRVGKDGKNLDYSGDSMVTDALGNVESCLSREEEVKKIKLSKEDLNQIRKDLPFLKDL